MSSRKGDKVEQKVEKIKKSANSYLTSYVFKM